MKIELMPFGGIVPKLGKHLLANQNATLAQNCVLGSGQMRPLPGMRYDHAVPTGTQTMYRWHNIWIHSGDALRKYCPGTIYGETQRLYVCPEAGGIYTWNGDLAHPDAMVKTGCPKPTAKPAYSLSGSVNSSVTKSSRVYVYTCVNSFGEESAPSPTSNVFDWQGQTVNLSNLVTPTHTGYASITKKRIYRLAVGDSSAGYMFVAEINASATTYADNVSDSSLGETLPTEGWHVPDSDLKGMVALSGGVYAAYHGNEVRCSEPSYPYAWPIDYAYTVEYDIVGLATSGSYLFIMTTGPVYYMSTDDLGSTAPVKMDELCPCVSARSIIPVSGGAVFASNDGLYYVSSGYSTPIKVSNNYYTITEWRQLNPRSMYGCYCNSTLYLAYITATGEQGVLMWSFGFDNNAEQEMVQNLTTSTVKINTAVVVPNGELMYVVIGSNCYQWNALQTAKMTAVWQSKSFLFQNRVNFSACIVEEGIDDDDTSSAYRRKVLLTQYLEAHDFQIDGGFAKLPQSEIAWASSGANSYINRNFVAAPINVVIAIFADNVEVFTRKIDTREPFCLPAGFTGRTWWIKVTSNSDIRRIAIAESMEELYE